MKPKKASAAQTIQNTLHTGQRLRMYPSAQNSKLV